MSAYASPYKRARTSGESSTSGWLAHLLGGLGVAGATYMGNPALAVPAYNLGYSIGSRIKDITGFGAYNVRKNTLAGVIPSVGNSSRVEGGLTISHREYLGDIITAATAGEFSSYSLTINPGNPQTWEWLAQIACNYEQWVPEGILFIFKSTSSDALNSTNTALGSVMMATQYDILAAPFVNKAEMLSYEYSSSGLPSESIIHMVECDPAQTPVTTLDVRAPNATSGDPRFADLGIFTIATQGFQGTNVNIGELWVTYQVTLLKPKLYASLGKYNDYIRFSTYPSDERNASWSGYSLSPNMSTLNLELCNFTVYPYSNGSFYSADGLGFGNITSSGLRIVQYNNTVVRIYWPQYAYKVTYLVIYCIEFASATTVATWGITSGSNYGSLSIPSLLYNQGTAASQAFHQVMFAVSVPGQKLFPYDSSLATPWTDFRHGNALVNVDSMSFTITQINCDQPLSTIS